MYEGRELDYTGAANPGQHHIWSVLKIESPLTYTILLEESTLLVMLSVLSIVPSSPPLPLPSFSLVIT